MATPSGVPSVVMAATAGRAHARAGPLLPPRPVGEAAGWPEEKLSTPIYTARMGHWSEMLVDEAAREVAKRGGVSPERARLTELLAQAAGELDILSGRSFRPARRMTSVFEPNGLPFVDVPDLQAGSLEAGAGAWAIPDPVNHQMATVLQVLPLENPATKAVTIAEAFWFAGQLLAEASRTGRLSREYVLHGLGLMDAEQRQEIMRRVMDPAVRFTVPILGQFVEGWWVQIARRLVWITSETEDEGRLFELLVDERSTGGKVLPLAAVDPILIVARMTRQPADWAFTARIWPEGARRPIDRPWRRIATAIHDHGIPTITLDPVSTPAEIACQVVLKGYWHGYLGGDEPALAHAVAMAYPRQVERIQRVTGVPDRLSAAATLLEQLIRPGFDPAQGAEATRRYVRRKASIMVMEYRKSEAPDRYPWTQVGISERRYYKLLPQFAEKVNGRYVFDQDDVVARMRAFLDAGDQERAVRTAALDVLHSHGFSEAAARKWLQRHRPEEAVDAWPRGRQAGSAVG